MTEERVFIDGDFRIGATISCEDRSRRNPAIIIVSGTGTMDRDGNAKSIHTDIYRNMSDMFAGWGFVTARFDKRGLYESEGDFKTAGLYDLVSDAASVLSYIRSQPYVDPDKVFICGHSEGAIIATLMSKRDDVAGVMLLGEGANSLKDALYYQNALVAEQAKSKKGLKGFLMRRMMSNPEKNKARVDAVFERSNETDDDKAYFFGSRYNAKWIREHSKYTTEDLTDMIRSCGKPVLAIIGKKDLHVDYRSLDAFKDAVNVECFTPDNVNHILREVDDDNNMWDVKEQYARLSARPMHQATADRMHDWLTSKL